MIKELTKLSQNHISFGSCAPAPLWGVEYALLNNTESQIESTLVQDEKTLIEGLEKGDYSLIVLHHPLQDKKYISQEFLNESLYLSVPPAHPLAPFREISFSDLNGQSVLLLTRIGFWNKVCQRMIPESHLLFQDDPSVFNELTKMSALPNFRSNITIQREEAEDNRILIPKPMFVIMRFIQKIKEMYFNLLLNKSKILIGKRQKSYLNDSSTYIV